MKAYERKFERRVKKDEAKDWKESVAQRKRRLRTEKRMGVKTTSPATKTPIQKAEEKAKSELAYAKANPVKRKFSSIRPDLKGSGEVYSQVKKKYVPVERKVESKKLKKKPTYSNIILSKYLGTKK